MNFKKTKNKEKTDINSDETIQSFRSWIRKIEQSTNSLGSRLSAVEKRISNKITDNKYEINSNNKKITNFFQKIKKDQDLSKNLEEVGSVIDDELLELRDEIIQQQIEIADINKKINKLNSNIKNLIGDLEKSKKLNENLSENIRGRLDKIEKREPISLKLGKMEIPIEITGLIGGILAIIIAILVSVGYKDLLISPVFLTLIGIILISSTLLKTFNVFSFLNRPFKKTGDISKSMEETQ